MIVAKQKTIDAAIGKWPGILTALGIEEKYLTNKHGPCPACQGTDRYRFDDKDGAGTFYCSNCGAGSGMDLLMRVFGWHFAQAAKNVDSVIGNVQQAKIKTERTEADKIAAIKRTLSECRKVMRGDPVWTYLNRRTGIEIVPQDLKYHPALMHSSGGKYPAMVAVMRGPDGQGISVHRTYLTADGQKANVTPNKKFMQGKPLNGSSVRLGAMVERVGIAEGIETALAASWLFSLPMVAATNATLLDVWMPPKPVKEVLICADHDASYTGHAAAYSLAKRLVRLGYKVEVTAPEKVDTDFAD
jgi:putative DNA primase/helicase